MLTIIMEIKLNLTKRSYDIAKTGYPKISKNIVETEFIKIHETIAGSN